MAEKTDARGAGDAAETSAEKDPRLAALARRYWRLWRRNWRPPFAADDAPGPLRKADAERSR